MRLEVFGVSVELKSKEVLKDVSLKLEEGEILAVLGPNGSGKSTLLRTIFGILKPKKGVVLFDGKKLNIEEVSKVAAYLPQGSPETKLKVIEIVLLGRTPHLEGLKRASSKDYEIALNSLKIVGMDDFKDRIFDELSGGEKQKVLLARIFAQEPKMMILDEPTAHLDISAQIEIMQLIKKKVEEKSCSTIISLHDINLASAFADKVMILKSGKVFYAGRFENLNEKIIKDVYEIDASVKKIGNFVLVLPKPSTKNNLWIHVICGGGSGVYLLRKLSEFKVSAGVLNALDTDWEIATSLGYEVISEAPFSEISRENHEKNLKIVEKCDLVILTNLAIGNGNLRNLIAAERAAELKKLLVVHKDDFGSRNFVGDSAEKIYNNIIKMSKVFRCEEDLLDFLKSLSRKI